MLALSLLLVLGFDLEKMDPFGKMTLDGMLPLEQRLLPLYLP